MNSVVPLLLGAKCGKYMCVHTMISRLTIVSCKAKKKKAVCR